MTSIDKRFRPFLLPEYCKGCGRCIAACTKECISLGTEINPLTGLVPVVLDLTDCNNCELCVEACPEPFGLRPEGEEEAFALVDPAQLNGLRPYDAPTPVPDPDVTVALPERAPRREGHLRGSGGRRPGRMPARLRLPDHAVHQRCRADGEGPAGATSTWGCGAAGWATSTSRPSNSMPAPALQ